ncbi:LexA family protein [Kluyvera genomosp. 1]|uniref:LexA family protein n=1 Tax=Kluyvera genomosp. 1 TaxID=2774053 RepID=UPI0006907A61|nr:XRE family transcriptional regulator [Kluyvera genomosp. 1]
MEKKKSLSTEQLNDAKRLKAIYEAKKKELRISQQDIADSLGISQGAVGHYLNGRNPLNLKVAGVFAKILGVSIEEFSPTLAKQVSVLWFNPLTWGTGMGSAPAEPEGTNSPPGNVQLIFDRKSLSEPNVDFSSYHKSSPSYPLISWVSAGEWQEACEPYEMHEIDEWYESNAHVEGPAFWLKVKGDSMTSPVGLSIPEGMMILVDTGKSPENGNLVVAKLVDANEATFKKYVIDEGMGNKYLQPLNPMHSRVKINGNCKIIGVAVQMMMNL